ncbi:MAG: nicotinamide riboside transporter PnuC [Pseudomonadales bacterium]
MESLLTTLQGMAWLELTGLISGLLCVWLLIRQSIWTFPIGLIYAAVSVAVFLTARLYADVLLSGYYLIMNAYGWYFWLYGAPWRRTRDDALAVTFMPARTRWWLAAVVALATAVMGWLLDTRTDAELAYWNSATTTMSFAAMWMTARKYIDNWVVWLVVDVLATGIYLARGIEFYALLYAVYLFMAVLGWRAWRQSMTTTVPV